MLQKATVELLDQALCASLYGNSLTDRMVCAGYLDGKVDSCQVSPGAHAGLRQHPAHGGRLGKAPRFLPQGSPSEKGESLLFLVPHQDVPCLLSSTALDFLLCSFYFCAHF